MTPPSFLTKAASPPSWQRARLAAQSQWRQRWLPLAARIDALPSRERVLLLVAGLAIAAAIEWLLVRPSLTKAERVSQASAQAQQELDDARTQRQSELQAQAIAWQNELTGLQARLQSLGAGAPGDERLGSLLQRALSGEAVLIHSLRELGYEAIDELGSEVQALTGQRSGPQNAPADPAVADATEPPASKQTLYRHRFELQLLGEPQALVAAVERLDQGLRPLRIERVRLKGRPGGDVEATLTLMVIGKEKQWLVF
jgi:type II secretory pathway component PulM